MKLTKTTARFPITNLTVPYILKDKNCMKKSKITSKAKLSDARPFPSSIMKIQHLKIKKTKDSMGTGTLDLRENSSSLTTTSIKRDTPPLFRIWSKILIDKVSPVLNIVILNQNNR